MGRETQVAFTNTMWDLLLAKIGALNSLASVTPTLPDPQRARPVRKEQCREMQTAHHDTRTLP